MPLGALAVMLLLPARVEAHTVGALRRAAADLRSDQGEARERAYRWLSSLDEGALPAVRARLGELARAPLEPEQARDALYAFRHAVGSRRADDMVDIAPGVLPVLAERRDAVVVGMAERLALARALEDMVALEAGKALCDLMGRETSPWPWRWEARRVADRMGPRAVPLLLVAAGHDSRHIRRWARRSLQTLGPPSVGDALRQAEQRGIRHVTNLLQAWGEAHVMDAMPTVADFVADPRRQVREAARTAVEGYGRNIIWQLRRVHQLHTGEDAPRSWGVERTRRALYEALDDARLQPARRALQQGLRAMEARDWATMIQHFEAALRDAPGEPSIAGPMAPGWADVGAARLAAGDWQGAAQAYRRALWAAPAAEEAEGWRRGLALAQAEQSLSAGVVNLPAFQAAAQGPNLDRARQAVDRLSGAARTRAHARRRSAAALAALLLAFAGLHLLRRRASPERDGDAGDDEGAPMAGDPPVADATLTEEGPPALGALREGRPPA